MKVYVKPVGEKWGVFVMGDLESLVDDARRYGLRVALYNAWWIIRHKPERTVNESRRG